MSTILHRQSVWTAEDIARMPDGERYELIGGELEPMAPAGEWHGTASGNLHALVGSYVLSNNLGRIFTAETGFHLATAPDTVLAPDFAFVAKDRCTVAVSEKFSTTVPDLVLETRSPSDSAAQVRRKVKLWLSLGVRVVWDLDPRRGVLTAHYSDGSSEQFLRDDVLTCAPLFPGLSVPIRSILLEM